MSSKKSIGLAEYYSASCLIHSIQRAINESLKSQYEVNAEVVTNQRHQYALRFCIFTYKNVIFPAIQPDIRFISIIYQRRVIGSNNFTSDSYRIILITEQEEEKKMTIRESNLKFSFAKVKC